MLMTERVITEADRRRLGAAARRAASGKKNGSALAPLRHALQRAQVVGSREVPRNVVTMNSRIVLKNLDTGNRIRCTLVYPYEARLSPSAVSVASPLGRQLLGKRVGQIVRWPGGNKERRMRIQQILYQPESAGDWDL